MGIFFSIVPPLFLPDFLASPPKFYTFIPLNQKTLIMKRLFLLFSAALCLLIACNNNKKPGITVTSEDGKTTTTISPDAMTATADAFTKKAEELQKLSPYTLDQVKALLPEELAGAKRSKF